MVLAIADETVKMWQVWASLATLLGVAVALTVGSRQIGKLGEQVNKMSSANEIAETQNTIIATQNTILRQQNSVLDEHLRIAQQELIESRTKSDIATQEVAERRESEILMEEQAKRAQLVIGHDGRGLQGSRQHRFLIKNLGPAVARSVKIDVVGYAKEPRGSHALPGGEPFNTMQIRSGATTEIPTKFDYQYFPVTFALTWSDDTDIRESDECSITYNQALP